MVRGSNLLRFSAIRERLILCSGLFVVPMILAGKVPSKGGTNNPLHPNKENRMNVAVVKKSKTTIVGKIEPKLIERRSAEPQQDSPDKVRGAYVNETTVSFKCSTCGTQNEYPVHHLRKPCMIRAACSNLQWQDLYENGKVVGGFVKWRCPQEMLVEVRA